ncbi:MAG TPA: hypothetical protein VNP73_09640 [Actinomycetota bacterium]|nr:hypothetical protein [Actinomycetota bacterium]
MTQPALPNDPVTSEERKWLDRALVVIRFVRDPAFPGVALLATVILAGFLALVVTWSGVARTIYVALQIPVIVSGGLGALALIGLGAALLTVQLDRREAAREQRLMDGWIDEIVELMGHVPALRARRTRGQTR